MSFIKFCPHSDLIHFNLDYLHISFCCKGWLTLSYHPITPCTLAPTQGLFHSLLSFALSEYFKTFFHLIQPKIQHKTAPEEVFA